MKKSVSKLLVVLMVLSLAIGLVACGGGNADSQYVGEWKVTSASASGVTIDMATIGLEMSMTINGNGTVSVTASGESGSGTWEETDTGIKISSDGESLEAKMVDGKLEMYEPSSGVTMYFEKQS